MKNAWKMMIIFQILLKQKNAYKVFLYFNIDSGYFEQSNIMLDEHTVKKILSIMGIKELGLYNYIFLRKLNRAF